MDFNDKLYIVTGAGSGIGRAIAIKINESGGKVIAIGRRAEKLEETKQISKNPENIFVEPYDLVENIDNLPIFVSDLKNKYGKLNGMACVAGIDMVQTLQMLCVNNIDKIFDINYKVPMMLTKGFSDFRNNNGEGSSIVYIASIAGVYPEKGQIVYAGSKAALIASVKAISKELSAKKIRANCISPAWVETDMFYKQKETIGVDIEKYSLGIGKPEDVASLAAYLLSDEARWITGQNYVLEGG